MSNFVGVNRAVLPALVLALAACAQPANADGLKVRYHTSYPATSNQIGPLVDLVNVGSSPISLGAVTLRYWFTPDGTAALRYFCDYTPRGCANVTARFVKLPSPVSNADTYLELGFSSAAGSLAAGQSTGDIHGRVAKTDWSAFDQRNDYSYDGTKTAAADWDRVTVYVNGVLAWGTEPTGGSTADTQRPTRPAGLRVSSVTSRSITLAWTASTDNVGVTGYDVLRGSTGSTVVGTSATATHTLTDLVPDTSYTFRVRARDAAGNVSAASAAVTGRTSADVDVRPPGILRVSSRSIVDDAGQPVALRGVAFGNAVWSDVEIPAADHGEIDYQRVRDMGMNLVRFYMNYRTFEDDAAPGVWKEAGFRWIDQNVAWAKAHGVRLLLNMHVPQGGFQSNGTGVALWNDVRNQDRLTALWREIARRYRSEPAILGYDLLNEPITAGEKEQWVQLANRIVRAIREVDPWHVITIERLNGKNADGSGASEPVNDEDLGFVLVEDPNVLYEFHLYTPMEFTFQLASWVPCCQLPTWYPDPTAISVSWSNLTWKHWSWDGTPASGALRVPDGTTPWTAYGVRFTITDPTWNVARPTFMSQRNAGTVYFDDFEVNEYDPQGGLVRQLFKADVEDPTSWYLWLDTSTPGAAGTRVAGPDGHAGARSVGISGTNTDATLSSDAYWFKVQVGNTYELKYWARGEGSAAGSTSLGRLEFLTSSVPVIGREKALLAADLERYAAWGEARGVPLYVGEFGTIRSSFDRGGLSWVADMLDLLATHGMAWTYHSYRGDGGMGVYWDDYPNPVDPANANDALIDLFRRTLGP